MSGQDGSNSEAYVPPDYSGSPNDNYHVEQSADSAALRHFADAQQLQQLADQLAANLRESLAAGNRSSDATVPEADGTSDLDAQNQRGKPNRRHFLQASTAAAVAFVAMHGGAEAMENGDSFPSVEDVRRFIENTPKLNTLLQQFDAINDQAIDGGSYNRIINGKYGAQFYPLACKIEEYVSTEIAKVQSEVSKLQDRTQTTEISQRIKLLTNHLTFVLEPNLKQIKKAKSEILGKMDYKAQSPNAAQNNGEGNPQPEVVENKAGKFFNGEEAIDIGTWNGTTPLRIVLEGVVPTVVNGQHALVSNVQYKGVGVYIWDGQVKFILRNKDKKTGKEEYFELRSVIEVKPNMQLNISVDVVPNTGNCTLSVTSNGAPTEVISGSYDPLDHSLVPSGDQISIGADSGDDHKKDPHEFYYMGSIAKVQVSGLTTGLSGKNVNIDFTQFPPTATKFNGQGNASYKVVSKN